MRLTLLFLAALSLSPGALGQPGRLLLTASQTQVVRVAPDAPTAAAEILVTGAARVVVDVVSSSPLEAVAITTPGGEVIDAATVGAAGGAYRTYEVIAEDIPAFPLPASAPGVHYSLSFPSPGDGLYVLEIAGGGSGETAVAVNVLTDSPVGAALAASENVVPLGRTVVLTAVLRNAGSPIPSVPVTGSVTGPSGTFEVPLRDDGAGADADADDGLYTAAVRGPSVGSYAVVANVEGAVGGAPFRRTLASAFEVVEQTGSIEGFGGDLGLDTDGDGDLDAVQIAADVDLSVAVPHVVVFTLSGASGSRLSTRAFVEVRAGTQRVEATLPAAQVRAAGGGAFTVDLIELIAVPDDGVVVMDRLVDAGTTAAYPTGDFDRPPVLFTGASADEAIDDDDDGDFDRLVVEIGVDVEQSGAYQWSGRLVDPSGADVAIGGGAGSLPAGENTLSFTFPGQEIAASGVDGPYVVTDVLLFSFSGTSSIGSDVATTAPYAACDFDGAVCDVTPPSLALAEAAVLWPPNHAYVSFSVADVVTAVVDPETGPVPVDSVRVVRVSSDEPENGSGDGNTLDDIVIAPDARSVQLRRERRGSGNGRVYIVTLAVSDPAGNEGTARYAVAVPKSRNRTAVDDGPEAGYTVEAGAPGAARTVADGSDALAVEPSIQHSPNPVSGTARLDVVSAGGATRVTVYDITGRVVRTLDLGALAAGPHRVALDVSSVAPGIYVYVLESGSVRRSGRMVVVR